MDISTSRGRVGIPEWVAAYVGIAFGEKGRGPRYDCWGLCRAVLEAEFGLSLPAYLEGYETTADAEEIGCLIRGEMAPWRQVPCEAARAGDVVLMRLMSQPMHVGVVVAPGWMLHIEERVDCCLERYGGAKWRRRVFGIYRHATLW